MELQRIAALYADPGPFASAYVEVSRTQEDGDRLAELQARAARDELVAQSCPEELARQVYEALAVSTHEGGTVSRCVVASERGVLLDALTHRHVPQPVAATWGEQVRAHFAALDVLEGDLREARLRLRDDVRLHQVARRTDEGWYADAQLLQQETVLRWSGGVDVYGATLLAGCDGTRRLGDLLAVLASSAGIADGEAAEQVLPVVERLVEQGFLVP